MISFIVPSHNYGSLISNCVSSIMKNFKNIREIIVINDKIEYGSNNKIKKNTKKLNTLKEF